MQNSFIKDLICSKYKQNLISLLTTVLGSIIPILQKEDLRVPKRSDLL